LNDKTYQTITVEIKNMVATLTLNRPEVHNAFNEVMLAELTEVFTSLAKVGDDVRVVVVTGNGKSFCAGADLNWMRETLSYTYDECLADSMQVSHCMYLLYSLPKPTIGKINGAAFGGGMGLVSACDIVIAQENATFSLSEVKLGLVPACISPYVIKKAGEGACRELFLSGERFSAEKAYKYNLVNEVVPLEQLDAAVTQRIAPFLKNGPEAMAVCKKLLEHVVEMDLEKAKAYTADVLSKIRIGEEGQEGMNAFLEKRKPDFNKYRE